MDRRITPPKRVTSPTWGPPPSCKQALTYLLKKKNFEYFQQTFCLVFATKKKVRVRDMHNTVTFLPSQKVYTLLSFANFCRCFHGGQGNLSIVQPSLKLSIHVVAHLPVLYS